MVRVYLDYHAITANEKKQGKITAWWKMIPHGRFLNAARTRIPRISDICMYYVQESETNQLQPVNNFFFLLWQQNKIPVLVYCPESVFPRLIVLHGRHSQRSLLSHANSRFPGNGINRDRELQLNKLNTLDGVSLSFSSWLA